VPGGSSRSWLRPKGEGGKILRMDTQKYFPKGIDEQWEQPDQKRRSTFPH